jgi:hypothetical protein
VRPVTQLSTRASTPDPLTAAPSRRRIGDQGDAWMNNRHMRYVEPCLAVVFVPLCAFVGVVAVGRLADGLVALG